MIIFYVELGLKNVNMQKQKKKKKMHNLVTVHAHHVRYIQFLNGSSAAPVAAMLFS